jgi:hypothetical protein
MIQFDAITTVQQLSDYLDVDEKTLRRWLREQFPKEAPGSGGQWELTVVMRREMRARAERL